LVAIKVVRRRELDASEVCRIKNKQTAHKKKNKKKGAKLYLYLDWKIAFASQYEKENKSH
jgi:hypothetical protein